VNDQGIDSPVWRLIEPAGLVWRCWDDEYVVFHSFSGVTHYIDPIAGAIFEALLDHPASADELTAALAGLAGAAPTDRAASLVRQVLRRFDELGLAESAP
jgi:PqqD family protein of HPr-rel-A system